MGQYRAWHLGYALGVSLVIAAITILGLVCRWVTSSPGILRFYNLKSQFQPQLVEGLSQSPHLSHSSHLCVHGTNSGCLSQSAGERDAREGAQRAKKQKPRPHDC